MTRTPLLLALAATAALAACGKNDDHTIVAGPDTDVANQAPSTNAPVTLPPSIAASKIYRCKVTLTAPEAGKPMVAQGYSLSGSPAGGTITLERPGKGSQSCKA